MGGCCTKCMLINTCCLAPCGCCNVCCTKAYTKEKLISYRNKEEFMEDVKTWKTGDIFLQHSEDSKPSQMLSNTPWTHCGVIYRRDDIMQQTALVNKEAEVMIAESVYGNFDENLEPNNNLNKYCLQDVRRRFDLNLWNEKTAEKYCSGYYFAVRKKKKELTDEQKRILEAGIIELKSREFAGLGQDGDWSAMSAAIDLGCCYCAGCHDLDDQESAKDLEKVFCSEALAYLFQQIGIVMKDIRADELIPSCFSSKKLFLYSTDGQDHYEKEVIYG
eukprot:275873_1